MPSSHRIHPAKMRRQLGGQKAKLFYEGQIMGAEFYNWLAARTAERFKLSRGRPSAGWEMRRLFPVRRADWERLGHFAKRLGVSPGQLAALLVESGLERLATEPRQVNAERTAS